MTKYNLQKKDIEELYINQQKSAKQIAELYGIKSKNTIFNFMKKCGIPRRLAHDSELRRVNTKKARWKGCGELSGAYWYALRFGANTRKIPFKISIEYAWELFQKQNCKCALSGVELGFWIKNNTNEDKRVQTASLDRIDPKLGYVEGNVQWIHKELNRMKMKNQQYEFINWCKLVTQHQEKIS